MNDSVPIPTLLSCCVVILDPTIINSYEFSSHSPESSMVTAEAARPIPKAAFEVPSSSPRISFSAEFLDDKMGFVSIGSEKSLDNDDEVLGLRESRGAAEFEFLLTNTSLNSMLSADELFHEGKLLPKFWLAEHCDDKSLEKDGGSPMIESRPWKDGVEKEKDERRSCSMNLDCFVDEDPSPRPPNCTILWKELLRLRKQRPASSSHPCPSSSMLLSPSSSSLTTSSSLSSMADVAAKEGKDSGKITKRMKKGGGLERTSLGTMRIRPMINVPICTVANASRLQQPLFPSKKGRVEW